MQHRRAVTQQWEHAVHVINMHSLQVASSPCKPATLLSHWSPQRQGGREQLTIKTNTAQGFLEGDRAVLERGAVGHSVQSGMIVPYKINTARKCVKALFCERSLSCSLISFLMFSDHWDWEIAVKAVVPQNNEVTTMLVWLALVFVFI